MGGGDARFTIGEKGAAASAGEGDTGLELDDGTCELERAHASLGMTCAAIAVAALVW